MSQVAVGEVKGTKSNNKAKFPGLKAVKKFMFRCGCGKWRTSAYWERKRGFLGKANTPKDTETRRWNITVGGGTWQELTG